MTALCERRFSVKAYKLVAAGAMLSAHALLFVCAYGAGLRFHAIHDRWPVPMVDQGLISQDPVMSTLEAVFKALILPCVLSVVPMLLLGVYTAYPDSGRATASARQRIFGYFVILYSAAFPFILAFKDSTLSWMYD